MATQRLNHGKRQLYKLKPASGMAFWQDLEWPPDFLLECSSVCVCLCPCVHVRMDLVDRFCVVRKCVGYVQATDVNHALVDPRVMCMCCVQDGVV